MTQKFTSSLLYVSTIYFSYIYSIKWPRFAFHSNFHMCLRTRTINFLSIFASSMTTRMSSNNQKQNSPKHDVSWCLSVKMCSDTPSVETLCFHHSLKLFSTELPFRSNCTMTSYELLFKSDAFGYEIREASLSNMGDRINVRVWWRPSWLIKKSAEMSLAPVLPQAGRMRGSSVFSEVIATSICHWQGQHISLQYLFL